MKHGVILLSGLLQYFDKFKLPLIDSATAVSPTHQENAGKVEIWEGNETMSKISDLRGQIAHI